VQIYIARLQKFSDALPAENKNVFSFATKVQTVQFNIRSSGGRLPYTWASHCRVPGADGSTSPWNVQGSGVGGQQRTSTRHGRHKDAVVGEVGRCQAMEALESNHRQLALQRKTLASVLCSALANQFEYTPYNSTDRINVTKTDAADRQEGQMERQTDIRQMHYAYR